MNSFAALFTSLVLFAPVIAGSGWTAADLPQAVPTDSGVARDLAGVAGLRVPVLAEALATPENNQVHIEQRVIIRIAPLRQRPRPSEIQEVPSGACIPIDSIAGARPADGNRLLLFMRDSRVLSAQLDRSCAARDFYLGFYLERNEDGRLCQSRDWLQSRAGANCQVEAFNRLISTGD